MHLLSLSPEALDKFIEKIIESEASTRLFKFLMMEQIEFIKQVERNMGEGSVGEQLEPFVGEEEEGSGIEVTNETE